ncbi:MAG: hypothetical protein FWG64_04880 [Firmicutes bacterium]|nr:hypothetical protein [Bacillota bacterium]
MKLTNNANAIISIFYREYLNKVADGVPMSTAINMGGLQAIHERFFIHTSVENIVFGLKELESQKLIEVKAGQKILHNSKLSTLGIIYLEEKFPSGIDDLNQYLTEQKIPIYQ